MGRVYHFTSQLRPYHQACAAKWTIFNASNFFGADETLCQRTCVGKPLGSLAEGYEAIHLLRPFVRPELAGDYQALSHTCV